MSDTALLPWFLAAITLIAGVAVVGSIFLARRMVSVLIEHLQNTCGRYDRIITDLTDKLMARNVEDVARVAAVRREGVPKDELNEAVREEVERAITHEYSET